MKAYRADYEDPQLARLSLKRPARGVLAV